MSLVRTPPPFNRCRKGMKISWKPKFFTFLWETISWFLDRRFDWKLCWRSFLFEKKCLRNSKWFSNGNFYRSLMDTFLRGHGDFCEESYKTFLRNLIETSQQLFMEASREFSWRLSWEFSWRLFLKKFHGVTLMRYITEIFAKNLKFLRKFHGDFLKKSNRDFSRSFMGKSPGNFL